MTSNTPSLLADRPTRHAAAVDACVRGRRSVRSFTDQPVSRQQVGEILGVAALAPSNSNTQPWRVHVLAGAEKRRFSDAMLVAYADVGQPPAAHFPETLPEPMAARQAVFGARYYEALDIDRHDADARARQSARNFEFFGAPVGLIFTTDSVLRPHSWLDCGLFIQTVMIAATARGLATCPQVSFARYEEVVNEHLGLDGQAVLCGMSLGYADVDAPVNRFDMPRERLDGFVTFRGFDLPSRSPLAPPAA